MEKALGEPLPDLPEFAHMERTFGANATCSIRRRDPLGLPGFDIVCLKERAEGVRECSSPRARYSARRRPTRRFASRPALPLFGPDIDDNRFVMEVGNAARAVSYTKGCFLGQEPIVMARDRAGHVNRAFLGMKVLEGGPLPPGTKLLPRRAGSGASDIELSLAAARGAGRAGYLQWKHQEPGTRLEAETPTGTQTVEVQ